MAVPSGDSDRLRFLGVGALQLAQVEPCSRDTSRPRVRRATGQMGQNRQARGQYKRQGLARLGRRLSQGLRCCGYLCSRIYHGRLDCGRPSWNHCRGFGLRAPRMDPRRYSRTEKVVRIRRTDPTDLQVNGPPVPFGPILACPDRFLLVRGAKHVPSGTADSISRVHASQLNPSPLPAKTRPNPE